MEFSPKVTKHHGCSLNPPGLRQAFTSSATIVSIWPCISNAARSSADQALHTVPDTVLLIGPWYSLPFLVIRHSISTKRTIVYYASNREGDFLIPQPAADIYIMVAVWYLHNIIHVCHSYSHGRTIVNVNLVPILLSGHEQQTRCPTWSLEIQNCPNSKSIWEKNIQL